MEYFIFVAHKPVTDSGKERTDFMLKTKRMFVTLLISAIFLIGGAFTALAAAPDGSFDAFEGNTIVGWAWDSSMPNTGVPVSVTITNKETGEQVKSYHQTAVTYRSDLKENGIGNGNHGFRISINWDALADGTYVVEGTVDGKALSNPKTYVKGESSQIAAENISAEENHEHTGLKSLGFFRTTGYPVDYDTARYDEDGKTIRLIFLKEEINGFRIHITVKKAPFYVEAE